MSRLIVLSGSISIFFLLFDPWLVHLLQRKLLFLEQGGLTAYRGRSDLL
jgi:hypothetical protein